MKKIILIAGLLCVVSNAWSDEKGLACIRYDKSPVYGNSWNWYQDFIINVDEKYILAYPKYMNRSNPEDEPPETSFVRHELLDTGDPVKWTVIRGPGDTINYSLYRGSFFLLEDYGSFAWRSQCEIKTVGEIFNNIYSRAAPTL